MKAYSMDLRERLLTDCDEGLKTRAVATKYRVSESWVRRLLQRRRERGEVAPRKGSGRRPKWTAYADTLRNAVREQPDITLHELKQRYALPLSVPTLSRTLHRLGLTFKKKCSVRRSRTVLT